MMFQPTHPHGVRQPGTQNPEPRTRFQPTHPHGVRQIRRSNRMAKRLFQPTHPHGVRRPTSSRIASPGTSFNPRTRTGCDWG